MKQQMYMQICPLPLTGLQHLVAYTLLYFCSMFTCWKDIIYLFLLQINRDPAVVVCCATQPANTLTQLFVRYNLGHESTCVAPRERDTRQVVLTHHHQFLKYLKYFSYLCRWGRKRAESVDTLLCNAAPHQNNVLR